MRARLGETWQWPQDPRVPNPMDVCELALEMGKSIRELTTGEPGMSAHELCVIWPTYRTMRQREQQTLRERAEAK